MFHRLLLMILCGTMLGCAAQDVARLQAVRNQTSSAITQAALEESSLKQQLAALPANDPVRKAIEPELVKLDALIARGQQYLPVIDGAISSARAGQIDPNLQTAVAAIPYGSLALGVVGIAWGLIKHLQAGKTAEEGQQVQSAFAQMVQALDAALPQPNAQQTAAVASVLDSDVKARAAVVRAV